LIDKALELTAEHSSRAECNSLGYNHQPIARADDTAESYFIESAKPNHIDLHDTVFLYLVSTELRGGFADHHSGHQGLAWHVPTNPELVLSNVVIPNANASLLIVVNDGGELLHGISLRYLSAYRLLIRNHAVEVVGVETEY